MSDPLGPLHTAVYTALTAGLGVVVYDYVPTTATMPYVTIGTAWTTFADSQDVAGFIAATQIDVWSRFHGFSEASTIAGTITDLLHRVSLSVTGFDDVKLLLTGRHNLADPDPQVRHVALTFNTRMFAPA